MVTEQNIQDANCTNCLLLISVSEENGKPATFTVEAQQRLAILKLDETRLGYVEKDATKRYVLAESDRESTNVVSVNSFIEKCISMGLYYITEEDE